MADKRILFLYDKQLWLIPVSPWGKGILLYCTLFLVYSKMYLQGKVEEDNDEADFLIQCLLLKVDLVFSKLAD